MFRITKGKTKTLDELRNKLYKYLNPKKKGSNVYRKESLIKTCSKKYYQAQKIEEKNFYLYLIKDNYKNLKEILGGTPAVLAVHMAVIDSKIINGEIAAFYYIQNNTPVSTKFGNKILTLFKYSNFRKTKKFFEIYEELGRRICNYCNLDTTISIKYEKCQYKSLFDCDHFVSKVKYPYLSVSFYNLIPSCSICNSRIKSIHDLNIDQYPHPYIDNLHDYFSFSTSLRHFTNLEFDFVIQQKADDATFEKVDRYINFFRVQPRYNAFKDEVRRLYKISQKYPKNKKDELFQSSKAINPAITESDFLDSLCEDWDIPRTTEEAANKALGKLKLDIATYYDINKWA